MKTKNFKFKQILNLHLLNSRAYEYATKNPKSDLLINFNLTQTIADLKKVLCIIFEYHQTNKRILFIGVPKKLESKINKLTNHVALPSNFELQGVVSNSIKTLKFIKKNKQFFSKISSKLLMPKLLKKPDLVVLFLHEKKQNIISESYISKVPLILFNYDNNSKNVWSSNFYNLQRIGDGLSATNTNLFFFCLNFLFKNIKKKVSVLDSKKSITKSFNSQILRKRFK